MTAFIQNRKRKMISERVQRARVAWLMSVRACKKFTAFYWNQSWKKCRGRHKKARKQKIRVRTRQMCAPRIKRKPRFSGCDGAHRKVEMCNAAWVGGWERVCPFAARAMHFHEWRQPNIVSAAAVAAALAQKNTHKTISHIGKFFAHCKAYAQRGSYGVVFLSLAYFSSFFILFAVFQALVDILPIFQQIAWWRSVFGLVFVGSETKREG